MEFEKKVELLKKHHELVEKGYNAYIRFGYLGKPDIFIHRVTNLVVIQKELGINLLKESDEGSMCARGEFNGTDVTIFPMTGVFPGCNLIEKRVLVPAVEEHYETKMVVECPGDKSD